MLKTLLLMETPSSQRFAVFQSFRGRRGYDLVDLRDRLAGRTARIPACIERDIAFAGSWTTDMRYEPSSRSYDELERSMMNIEFDDPVELDL